MSTTTRRAPLASIPNGTNSPHRLLVASGSKRSRSLANVSQQENEPPQKKQMVEKDGGADAGHTTPRKRIPASAAEGRVFERGPADTQPTAFQRKLVAARDKTAAAKVTKNTEGHSTKDAESIRQWQRHYRRIFPSFSFYFESIPEELRIKFARQIASLGAQEEKFFSRTVTHIITTRPIPPEVQASKPSDSPVSGSTSQVDDPPQTINPSLLEKNAATLLPNGKLQSLGQNGTNFKRDGSSNMDVLTRGRQMGMKIWSSEKFNRILASILDDPAANAHNTRSNHAALNATRVQQEDLSQVLRNEKLGASSEREQATLARDLVLFKGPFIYIHDIDEKVRPTMVREYPKVAKRSDGEWPQFRSATVGKCPFVEDPATKKEIEQERTRDKALALQQQKEAQQAPRTRSFAATAPMQMDPPRRTSPRKTLQELHNITLCPPVANQNTVNKAPASLHVDRQPSFPPMPNRNSVGFIRPPHMYLAGEPAASGIQKSAVTSAIQSQMISSTAAAPGAKAGTSREVHELKRKVLERTHTGSLSVGSMPSSHRMADLAGALKTARAPAPQRAAKSRAQEKLGGVPEEIDPYGDDLAAEREALAVTRKKKPAKRDPKPGYCENCRDKYDDFEEHTVSRKHRKFAMTQSNWTELDELLRKLQG